MADAQNPANLTVQDNKQKFYSENGEIIDLIRNGFFISINKTSGFPLFWKDSSFHSCVKIFACKINGTEGWVDNQSFQLSTKNISNGTCSWIYRNEVDVRPDGEYEVLTHMKTNKWATGLHILLRGFNESSQKWYQIEQCPSGINGPLEWKVFNCKIIIPQNTTKIKPILNAGWSSREGEKAVTSFDAVHLYQIK